MNHTKKLSNYGLSSRETNARVSRTVLTDTAADILRQKMTNFEVSIESWEKDIFRAHVLVTTRKTIS